MRHNRLVLLALLAAAATPALAQPFPPSPPDRRVTVAGWRVVHVNDEDGGRDVGMSVSRAGIRIDYSANYWRGNGRLYHRAHFQRAGVNCNSEEWGGEPGERDFRAAGAAQRLRGRLVGALALCGVGRPQAERAMQGFAAAYARLAAFADQAQTYTDALNCSIEHYPEGEAVVRRLCHRR